MTGIKLMEFKIFDEVILTDIDEKNYKRGYIDTITNDRYRIRLMDGYEWVVKDSRWLTHADEREPVKVKTKLDYLG